MYRDVNIDVGGKGGGAIRLCIIHFYMVVFYEEPGERLWSFFMKTPGEIFLNSRNFGTTLTYLLCSSS